MRVPGARAIQKSPRRGLRRFRGVRGIRDKIFEIGDNESMVMKKKEHLEILAEDIQSKFDLVLEGHAGINRRLDELTESVRDERQERVLFQKALSNQIREVDQRLGNQIREVDQRLGNQIREADQRLGAKIESGDQRLEAKIDGVEQRLGDRISQVETNLRLEIRGIAADLAEHRADTEAHRAPYRVSEPS